MPPIAQSQDDQGALSQLLENLKVGKVTISTFGYLEESNQDDIRYPALLLIKQDVNLDLSASSSLVAGIQYRADTHHFTAGILDEINETHERRFHFNLPEAYVRFSGDRSDFYLGKKIYSWGKADGFNPVDNINPFDYLDFLNHEKIGVVSAGWSYSGTNAGIDLVYIPFFTPCRTPDTDNRWLIEPPIDFPINPAFIRVDDRMLPTRQFKNSQGAVRFWMTWAGLDVALTAYKGFDPIPAAETGLDPQTAEVVITPVYNEIEEYGLSLSRVFGGTSFHFESSYRMTEANYDDDFLSYVFGLNHSFYVGKWIEEIRLIAEYADESWIHFKHNEHRFTTDLGRPFRDSFLISIDFRFGEYSNLKLSSAYNLDEHDYYFQPKFNYSFTDTIKLDLGLDILNGQPGTFWGNWAENDRGFIELEYFF